VVKHRGRSYPYLNAIFQDNYDNVQYKICKQGEGELVLVVEWIAIVSSLVAIGFCIFTWIKSDPDFCSYFQKVSKEFKEKTK